MESLPQDVRYALRQLRRSPVFTLAAAATLAVGIGANTAIFSLLYQTLLRMLPVREPQQLVELRFAGAAPGHTHSEGGDTPDARAYFSYPIYRDLRDRCTVFSGLVAYHQADTAANQMPADPSQVMPDTPPSSGGFFDQQGGDNFGPRNGGQGPVAGSSVSR